MHKHNTINSSFQFELSTYQEGNRRSEVWRTDLGAYAGRFYENNVWVVDEVYTGYSEEYAENACENYVMGIKNV